MCSSDTQVGEVFIWMFTHGKGTSVFSHFTTLASSFFSLRWLVVDLTTADDVHIMTREDKRAA